MNREIGQSASSSSFLGLADVGSAGASPVQLRPSSSSKRSRRELDNKGITVEGSPRGKIVAKEESDEFRELLGLQSGSLMGQSSHSCHGFSTDLRSTSTTPQGFIRITVTRNGKEEEVLVDAAELLQLKAKQNATRQRLHRSEDIFTVPSWVQLHPLLGSYATEAIGTFAWALSMALGKSTANSSIFDPLNTSSNVDMFPTGLVLSALIFAFGYISGAHFNPAVTIAVFLAREIKFTTFLNYMIIQCLTALGAGIVAMLILNDADIFVPSVSSDYISSGLFSEWIFSLAIALIALNTRYSQQRSNFYYGVGMGMGVAAGYAAVSTISGGSFNPAIASGLQAAKCFAGDCGPLQVFWIYWLGPLVGALVASLFFSQMDQPEETSPLLLRDSRIIPLELPVEVLEKRLREEEERNAAALAVAQTESAALAAAVEARKQALRSEGISSTSRVHQHLKEASEMSRSQLPNDGEGRDPSLGGGNHSADWILDMEGRRPSAMKKSRSQAGDGGLGEGGNSAAGRPAGIQGSAVSGSRSGGGPLRIQFSGVNYVYYDDGEDEGQRSNSESTQEESSHRRLV